MEYLYFVEKSLETNLTLHAKFHLGTLTVHKNGIR